MTKFPVEGPRRIGKKVRDAIDLLTEGDAKDITQAAQMAGVSRSHLSRQLALPHVTDFMFHKVRRKLSMKTARAGLVKGELLDCDNSMVRDRAANYVLALAGIAPATQPSVNISLQASVGYVIDLSEPDDQKVIDVTNSQTLPKT